MLTTSRSLFVVSLTVTWLISFISVANASHFRGGLVHWKTVGKINQTTGVTVDVTQRYGWRRSYGFGSHYCDADTISNPRIIADSGSLSCRVGCRGTVARVGIYCTDYSMSSDWSVGERTQRVSLSYAPVIEASFASTAWIGLIVGGGNWEVRTKLNLNATLAKRNENSSPETKIAPIVHLLYGCNHTITIPVEDADGDVVQCRWAEHRFGECGGVCRAFPDAVLNERDCTLFYSATGRRGYYAVAIQIEDFFSTTDTTPLSSVPLQFLVNVYESTFENASCYGTPGFSWPTRRDGVCVGIPLNSTFHEAIIAAPAGPGITIQEIATQSPTGVRKSDLDAGPGANNWHVNITWTPLPSQVGNNIFCFTAVDSSGSSSEQNCITFAVGTEPPVVKAGSLFPTGTMVLPDSKNWGFQFDRQFIRPRRAAYIRFHDDTDRELFRIDTSTNTNAMFSSSPTDLNLKFTTTYTFMEKATYYVTIDHGIAYGTEACGPESVGIFDPYYWRFTIKDVTPPVLTFLPYSMHSGGSVDIAWGFDEPAWSTCIIQGPSSTFTVTCNDTMSLSNLTEGDFTLFIQASDVNGNAKQYQTDWYIDLTAPVVTITSNPPLIVNTPSGRFTVACSDRSPCQLWCAEHALNQTELMFVNCSSAYMAFSPSDGVRAFTVYGVDVVGNVGDRVTYTWTVDTIAPAISALSDVTVACGSPYDPSRTGIPSSSDNTDQSPSISYNDMQGANCRTLRTWTVTDHAGNTANTTQTISFTNVIGPTVAGAGELFVPCGETDRLTSPDYVLKALNVTSPCGRKVTLDSTDSRSITECGIAVTRQWSIRDDCGSLAFFTQTIHVLFQSFPDFPANGQMHVGRTPMLGWPTYPQSQGYNIYIWQYGTSEPTTPTSFVHIWRRSYTVAQALPPNTRFLWRIGYIVPFGNGTREIPSPTWGFHTETYADLSLFSVTVPPTAHSGSQFSVTWVVMNIGNVSTSQSTSAYYDAIYLSRSSDFRDAYVATWSRQQRYVDPQDGYTFSDDVNLRPSDIGDFYVFVGTDVHGYISDFSTANNRLLAPQPVQVKLTPPPNLQVTSANIVGFILSGQQTTVRITVENSGLGITQATRWYDQLLLSEDDRRSRDDRVLVTRFHNGALASRQQYVNSVAVTIPNAIYGDYHIIVSTDIFQQVFEHTDDDDNDYALQVSIRLSPYPDLIVSNITVPSTVSTGDRVLVLATIKNIGAGEPFEYSWQDKVDVKSKASGVIAFSSTYRHVPGRMPFSPSSTYVSSFEWTVPPTAQSGEYNVTVSADAFNQVFEFQSNDNNQETEVIRINQVLPDLTLGSSSAVVIENGTGNYLAVDVSVLNVGPGKPQIMSWENAVVLEKSRKATQLTSFLTSNTFAQSRLTINLTTYISSSIVGTFDVYASIDSRNQVVEANDTNNYVFVGRVTFNERVPDLAIRNLSATSSAESGSLILVSWVVENVGNLASRSELAWFDDITLTESSGSRMRLSRVLVSFADSLQPRQSYSRELNVTIPSNLAGSYRLGVTTALYRSRGVGAEINQGNNYMELPIAVSVPPSPDFRPTDCSHELSSQFNVRLLFVTCTVVNLGNSMDKPTEWSDRISLVNADGSAVVSSDAIGTRKLSYGDTYLVFATLVISPVVDGYFQVEVQADASYNVTEIGGENNNVLRAASVVFIPPGPSPRLSVFIEPLKQTTLQSGATLEVNCSVTNTGEADLLPSTWTDALFLFQTPRATKQQVILSAFLVSSVINNYGLKLGASYTETFRGVIPYSIRGTSYLYVVTDANDRLPIRAGLSDKAAHLNTTVDIERGPVPDLAIFLTGNLSVVRVQSGQIYSLEYTVSNNGNASASGLWYDSVYLSQEKFLDPFDIALKTVLRPRPLPSGESYTQQVLFTIPYDLSAVNYYFIVTANVRREVFESSFDNNNEYQFTEIVVLPAVDLVVMNVSSSVSNATYYDQVEFRWIVANNGSIASFGHKCDSVYLSDDDVWEISDVTVIQPRCGFFRLDPTGSANDRYTYSAGGRIPPVAKGSYKSIVRTRSNVRDYNLQNNIGVSVMNISVFPPTIRLGENRTFDMTTNQDITFELTNIPVGIGLIVRLNTLYKLAYHGLFIKRNSPPASNDFDVAYRHVGTTQQSIYVPFAKSGDYYLLVQSTSAVVQQSYQISISVREARFELTAVYPPVLTKDATVTLRLSGTLFGRNLEAFLTNNSGIQTAATNIYRYVSDEAYATFTSSELTVGTYGVLLQDAGRNQSFELKNVVEISGLAPAGKLQVNILTPNALRPGRIGIVEVKVDNSGFSDVSMPLLIVTADDDVRLLSTQSDVGVFSSENIMFFPLSKNRPPSIILPKSSAVYSFSVIPEEKNFVGNVPVSVLAASDELMLEIIQRFKANLQPTNIDNNIWNIVWRNVEECFGNNPTSLLHTVNSRFTQHYTTSSPIDSLIGHVVEVADGTVPQLILSQSVDVEDKTYFSSLVLNIEREYTHRISVRKTVGLFGLGWSSPVIEMSVNISEDTILLIKQRQTFNFHSIDNNHVFFNRRLSNDRITLINTSVIYASQGVSYTFDMMSGLLVQISDEAQTESISISYTTDRKPMELTRNPGRSAIGIEYGENGFISRSTLSHSGTVLSQAIYTYDDDGSLIRVRAGNGVVTEYQYTENGDLNLAIQDQRRTSFEYDRADMMTRTVDYVEDAITQELLFRRYCDGSIKSTILPQNLSSFTVFGVIGELIENSADGSLPVTIKRDNVEDTVYVIVGDEVKQTHSFDRRLQTYFVANGNDEKLAVKLRPDGRVTGIGSTGSPYYNATYDGNVLSSVSFRDGTEQIFGYDDQGRRTSVTLRDGSQISYSYDDNQYLSAVHTAIGSYVYIYDSNGLLTAITPPNDGTTTLSYDSQQRPISVGYPDGTTLTYTYNECGQRSSLTSNTGYNCSYVYDSLCRLSSVLGSDGSVLATYEYGQHSQLVKKQLANGMYTEYEYEDGSLRLQKLQNFFSNGTLLSYYSYVYDEWGYRVQTETNEGVWTFRYDAIGQLIEWRSPFSNSFENIEYGNNLNRKSKETDSGKLFYATNPLHQYTTYANSQNFSYDLNGNLLTKSEGNGSRMYVEQYEFDQEGRFTSITAELLNCHYKRNAFEAVFVKNCSNGYNARYLVDPFGTYGTNVLAEYTAFGHKIMYYGQEHGLLAAMDSMETIFYLFDGDGSAVHTASQTAEILTSYMYDPFGRVLSRSASNDGNLFRFLAQYGIRILNETTHLVFIRNRIYDSEHGRFISPDPTGVFGSPTNPYSYGNNNPLTFKDPNGEIVPFVVGVILKPWLKQIGKGAAKEALKAARNYFYKNALSGDKFDLGKFAKAVGKGALNGAITSANPLKSLRSQFAFSFGATLLTGGNVLDALESGAVNFLPEPFRPLYGDLRLVLDELVSQYICPDSGVTKVLQDTIMRWVQSIDPNEITGPVGYGDANYISADQSLLYKIEFENNPNATAPAQRVIIRCPIDSNLELGTFRVGKVRFDVYEKDFQFRSSHEFANIDATDKTGTLVYVQVLIDVITQEAIWLLQSFERHSGLPPIDPLIGFLPPNNGTDGQGYVTFSIDLKSNVQSLTKVVENASIVFDENPHIDTSTVFHTIDNTPGTVSINVSTLFGGAVFNLVTGDVGSGVKSVDLYVVADGSATLIKSDINQSVVVVDLTENVLHTIVGVAIDNVGNTGTLDPSGSVGVYVPADCPANCSGRGQCGSRSICICDSGYGGYNCSLNTTSTCEPPILEVRHSDSVRNESLAVFISARSSQSEPPTSISVRIVCAPNDTVISKGRQKSDGVYLDETDFGNVQLTIPSWFYGLFACTIKATVVDVCGTNVRAVLLATNVLPPPQQSADMTSTVTAAAAPEGTAPTVHGRVTTSGMGVTAMSRSPGVSQVAVTARTIGVTGTEQYVSQPPGRTGTPGAGIGLTGMSPATPGVSQVAVTARTIGVTGTEPYVSQPPGRTGTPGVAATVSITQVAGGSEATVTSSTIWGPWSNWSPCSRTCDNGVQERTRQCLLSPSTACGSGATDRRFCQLSTCPENEADATEGSVITMSRSDTAKVVARLLVFLRWVANAVNSYCFDNSLTCCTSVFDSLSGAVQRIRNFTSVDLVRLAAGYPSLPTGNADALTKVIVMVDRSLHQSPCMVVDGRRRKRQTDDTRDLVPFNTSLLTAALLASQSSIESELNVTIMGVDEATADDGLVTTVSTVSTTSDAGGIDSTALIAIIVVAAIVLILLLGCLLAWWSRRRSPDVTERYTGSTGELPMRVLPRLTHAQDASHQRPITAGSAGVYVSATPGRVRYNNGVQYGCGHRQVRATSAPLFGYARGRCQTAGQVPMYHSNKAFLQQPKNYYTAVAWTHTPR